MKIYRLYYGMKVYCSPTAISTTNSLGSFHKPRCIRFIFSFYQGEKLNWMNHFYRQVACKLSNYDHGCQINYAMSIITNLSDINLLEI